ncbi:MAG TPA: hypothetical protein DEP66_06840, partial [Acidimicrobiaceae bacterium]|nr:hypothetical protein [Acidimicrobiaceae bacterium]
ADLGGAPVERHEYRMREGSGSFGAWVAVGKVTTTVVSGLAGGTVHHFVVRAGNSAGAGAVSPEVRVTPESPNAAPTVAGRASVVYAENGDGVVGRYAASDDDAGSAGIAWSLGGADA